MTLTTQNGALPKTGSLNGTHVHRTPTKLLEDNCATKQIPGYVRQLVRLKLSEQQANESLNRLRQAFLGSINHEMRTPLALLFQSIEIMEDSNFGPLTEDQRDTMTVLRRQAETIRTMIEGLTRVAAFLGKHGEIKPVWARLEPALDNALTLAEFKARSKELTIETKIKRPLPPLHLDVKEMEEALNQLLDNAIKFNRQHGKIQITVHALAKEVILTVADTGYGIPPEILGLIWDIFEQGADPLRRAREGLGIGLSLARFIIEAHHGSVGVKTFKDKGSVFVVKLPIPAHGRDPHFRDHNHHSTESKEG